MKYLKYFIAGFLATLVFHQGLIFLFFIAKVIAFAPWDMSPSEPLGVPKVISLAFWGGIWGIVQMLLLQKFSAKKLWLYSLIIGAVGPTTVAMLVVFPLKAIEVVPAMWIFGLILNGAWGIGTTLFCKWMKA